MTEAATPTSHDAEATPSASPPSTHRHTALLAALALLVLATLAAIFALQLPWWYAALFLAALPLDYLALRTLAHHQRKRWSDLAASLLDRRADRFQPPNPHTLAAIARWWFPPHTPEADLADLYEARARTADAGRAFARAADLAPLLPAAHLARQAWRCHRLQQRALFEPDQQEHLLRLVTRPGDASDDEHAALAHLLIEHRNDPRAAEQHLRRALARTEAPTRRFRILCQLAVAATLDGRFGAGDGYLAEAHDEMPSNDPGFQAYYARVAARIDRNKSFSNDLDTVIQLRALIEGPPDLPPPSALPEAPDED